MGIYEYIAVGSTLFVGAFYLAKTLELLSKAWDIIYSYVKNIDRLLTNPVFVILTKKLGFIKYPANGAEIEFAFGIKNYGFFVEDTVIGKLYILNLPKISESENTNEVGWDICSYIYFNEKELDYDLLEAFLELKKYVYRNREESKIRSVKVTSIDENGLLNAKRVDVNIDTKLSKQMNEIIDECSKFASKKQLYDLRGLMWKRSFALCGPPGTGKTKFVMQLAALTCSPLVYVKPTIASLTELSKELPSFGFQNASSLNEAKKILSSKENLRKHTKNPKRHVFAIIVFDDIDHDLRASDKLATTASPQKLLMEFLDGSRSVPGISILTMNDRKVLEEYSDALMRPGRCDKIYEFGPVEKDMAENLIDFFLPDVEVTESQRKLLISKFTGKTVAHITAAVGLLDDVDSILETVKDW